MLEGTLLALAGIVLFQMRHRIGLIPFLFLLGALALSLPFTAHVSPLQLDAPWTIGRAYAVVLPVFIALVLLLHILAGPEKAGVASALPAIGGVLTAAATVASSLTSIVIPDAFLQASPGQVLVTGLAVSAAAAGAVLLFQWLHRNAYHVPVLGTFMTASLAGLLAHAVVVLGLGAGVALPGVAWPAIAAVPVLSGFAPTLFVATFAHVLLGDLAPLARSQSPTTNGDGGQPHLDSYRKADRRYREALQKGHEASTTYEDMLGQDPDGVFVAQADGRVIYANPTLARILGRPVDDLVGSHATAVLYGQDGDQPHPPGLAELGPGEHRVRAQLPHGERLLDVELTRPRDRVFRGRVRDRTETELRDHATLQAKRARFALEVLTSDVPNHLAGPRTNLELVDEELPTDGPAHRALENARAGIEELAQLLDRLQVLQELETIEPGSYDAGECLRSVGEHHFKIDADRPPIRWDLPGSPVSVLGSPVLAHAFDEILANAYEHAGPEPDVTVSAERREDGWLLRIDDTGPGIPNEMKGPVLEGFMSKGRGRGIGLYLARTIVEAFGGDLWIDDRVAGEPSSGASVRLWLPAAGARTPAPTALPQPAPTEPAIDGASA